MHFLKIIKLLSIVVLCVIVLLFVFIGGIYLYSKYTYKIVPKVAASQIDDFQIISPNSQPITTISVWNYETDTLIWKIVSKDWRKIHFDATDFTIGHIPKGMRQIWPNDQKIITSIEDGTKIVISIHYIHDSFFAPGSSYDSALFKKTGDRFVLIKHLDQRKVNKPIWDSKEKREEGIKALYDEINKGQSLFLRTANNPKASPAAMNTVKVLMKYAKKDNPVEAYIYLRQLKEMDLKRHDLSDISVLQDFEQLERLDLGSNKIKDVSPLKDLPRLYALDLSSNPIDDFTPIGKIPSVIFLNISNTGVKEFKFLSECTTLKGLTIENNGLTDAVDFSVLSHLDITDLELSFNFLRTASSIKALSTIENLKIKRNKLKSVDFVTLFPKLSFLDLSFNELEDITPLIKHYKNRDIEKSSWVYLTNNKLIPKKQIQELKRHAEVMHGSVNWLPEYKD